MRWRDVLTGQGFRDFLVDLTQGRIPTGTPLDPFVTSNRRLVRTSAWLTAVERGERFANTDRTQGQGLTDLARAGLVTREDDIGSLTPLGAAVLERWRDHGLDDDHDDHEVARAMVLVQEGLRLRASPYPEIVDFWTEVSGIYDPDTLLETPAGLYLLSYLNQDRGGFNPWHVVRSARAAIGERGRPIEWEQLLDELPGDDVADAVERLRSAVQGWETRARGRVDFCRGMHLALQAAPDARDVLDRWSEDGAMSADAAATCRPLIWRDTVWTDDTGRVADVEALLDERANVVLFGPPGTGKTHTALTVARRWAHRHGADAVFTVTFHPSYSYEDFVQGFRPHPDQPGVFRLADGVLLQACSRARELASRDADRRVLLLIDEINRGDTARIFGELITFIERDKRGVPFHTSQQPDVAHTIPANLFLLGTMNTADRSVSLLDVAMRRRFAFVGLPPEPQAYDRLDDWAATVHGIALADLLTGLNQRLIAEGVEEDRAIGHALLAVTDDPTHAGPALWRRFAYDIHPLVSEYCAMDRTGIRRVLGGLVDDRGSLLPYDPETFADRLATLTRHVAP